MSRAPLDRSEKLVLHVLANYLNWSTWRCWPSVRSIADHAAMTRRGVQKVLDRLRACGLVRLESRSRGGVVHGRGATHTVAVNIEALEASAPTRLQRRTARAATANAVPPTVNAVRTITPSIHDTPIGQTIRARAFPAPAWMDGECDLRGALAHCGVQGPNLEALAAVAGLTVEQIRQDWESIRKDHRVRNPSAVLVQRLGKAHGIVVGRAAPLSREMAAANLRLMSQRRLKQTSLPSGFMGA